MAGLLVAAMLGLTGQGHAEESVDHYAADAPGSFAEAVEQFTRHNAKISEILERKPLTVADMEEIHEITYTLEVALARINADMAALPSALEDVHLASEGDDPDRLRALSGVYLDTALGLGR